MTLVAQSLVRAIEVWKPNSGNTSLTVSSGIYGDLAEFKAARIGYQVKVGEGIPGRVLQNRSAMVVPNLFDETTIRSEAEQQAELTSGVGLPCVVGGKVVAVVVFLCAEAFDAEIAFEVWSRNNRRELGLTGSHFANLERFGRISQFIKFPLGAGLPGQVWESRFPKIIEGLETSPDFMRATGGREDGLSVGVGLPVMRGEHDLDSTFVILSSKRTPVAKVFEIWEPNEAGEKMCLHRGAYGDLVAFGKLSSSMSFCPGECLVGKSMAELRPFATEQLDKNEWMRGEAAISAGLRSAVYIPIVAGKQLRAVFTMFN